MRGFILVLYFFTATHGMCQLQSLSTGLTILLENDLLGTTLNNSSEELRNRKVLTKPFY